MASNPDPSPHRRKNVRLPEYDYREPGPYFVTLCTEQRFPLFGTVRNAELQHSDVGAMVHDVWNALLDVFPGIALDAMILMPDHLHGVVVLGTDPDAASMPSLSDVVRYFKGRSTTRYLAQMQDSGWPALPGRLWQRRYQDRIVRSDIELERIRDYVEANPYRWSQRAGENV